MTTHAYADDDYDTIDSDYENDFTLTLLTTLVNDIIAPCIVRSKLRPLIVYSTAAPHCDSSPTLYPGTLPGTLTVKNTTPPLSSFGRPLA